LIASTATEGGTLPSAFPRVLKPGRKWGKSPEYPISKPNHQILRHSWLELQSTDLKQIFNLDLDWKARPDPIRFKRFAVFSFWASQARVLVPGGDP